MSALGLRLAGASREEHALRRQPGASVDMAQGLLASGLTMAVPAEPPPLVPVLADPASRPGILACIGQWHSRGKVVTIAQKGDCLVLEMGADSPSLRVVPANPAAGEVWPMTWHAIRGEPTSTLDPKDLLYIIELPTPTAQRLLVRRRGARRPQGGGGIDEVARRPPGRSGGLPSFLRPGNLDIALAIDLARSRTGAPAGGLKLLRLLARSLACSLTSLPSLHLLPSLPSLTSLPSLLLLPPVLPLLACLPCLPICLPFLPPLLPFPACLRACPSACLCLLVCLAAYHVCVFVSVCLGWEAPVSQLRQGGPPGGGVQQRPRVRGEGRPGFRSDTEAHGSDLDDHRRDGPAREPLLSCGHRRRWHQLSPKPEP